MRAIVATRPGGPEVLEYRDVPDPTPGKGQLLVAPGAIGVNFIDTYRRENLYPVPFPHVPGSEGAGTVVAVGPGVDPGLVGIRRAWATSASGSYAPLVVVDADQALPVPEDLPLESAAALALQGMTAHYLTRSTFPLGPGHQVLLHAAAGGVGLLVAQMARRAGAHVIGVVSTSAKARLAREAGAETVIVTSELHDLTTELPHRVREASGGGAHVAYDGVGAATFDASLASLRPRGVLVLFGAASGPVPPFDPQRLNAGGSLYLTRPTLAHYTAHRAELLERATDVFDAAAGGRLTVRVGQTFPLERAAEAHRALEGRTTTGKVLLLP